jgi:tetratricopeptide (TPR) repeat protein
MMRINEILLLTLFGMFTQCSDRTTDANTRQHIGENGREMNTDAKLLELGKKYYSDPDNKVHAINYTEALIKNRYYTAALKLLDEISGKFPEDGKVNELFQDAVRGAYNEYNVSDDTLINVFLVISELDRQIQTAQSDAGLYNKRGIFFLQINNLNAAEFDFTRACQIDCTFYNSFYNSIYVRYLMDKNSEALNMINNKEKNIRYRDVSEKQTIFNIRKVLTDLTAIENNLSLDEKNKSLEKAKIYVKLKDFNLAINKLNSAIQDDHNFGNAYALRAMVYYYMNYKSEALKDLEMAEKLTGTYNTPLSKMIRGS